MLKTTINGNGPNLEDNGEMDEKQTNNIVHPLLHRVNKTMEKGN